jgi:hypothetical protein
MKRISKKKQDAKLFESAISAENKMIIEKVLATIDAHSPYAVHQAMDALKRIIGDRAGVFLRNLLSAYDLDDFVKDLDLTPETLKYISFLFATYGSKLHGVISDLILETPDSLCSSAVVSTRYDLETKEPIIKIEIVKDNKETIIIEDSAKSLVYLSANIIDYALQHSSEIAKFCKNLGIDRGLVARLKRSVKKLDQIVSTK